MGIFHNGIFLCRFESKGQLMKIVCQDKNDKNKGRNQDEIDQFGQVFFFFLVSSIMAIREIGGTRH